MFPLFNDLHVKILPHFRVRHHKPIMEWGTHLTRITNAKKSIWPVASPNVNLRSWLNFQLQQCIVIQERAAFHNKLGPSNIKQIKSNYNDKIKTELWQKYLILHNLGREHCFTNFFAVNDHLITWEHNNWQVLTLFQIWKRILTRDEHDHPLTHLFIFL